MKSKSLIGKQVQKKTNLELVKTILAAKKNDAWIDVARTLSGPRQNFLQLNLEDLNKFKEEIIAVPGKVLSQGEIENKKKIIALNFSEKAKEKLLKTKCEVSDILTEIKKNPEANGVKILR